VIERLNFYFRHSLNDLRVNKQRTLFALLCIAAGVAAIVSLQTLAVMMNKTLTGSLQESNRGDMRLVPQNSWGSYIVELGEDDMTLDETSYVFTAEGVEHLREWFNERYPGTVIAYRQAVTGFGVALSASIPDRDTDKFGIYSYIIEADRYPVYGKVETDDGETLKDLLKDPTDIVLSENLAGDLEAEVGDKLRLAGASEDFTVRGIVPADSEGGFQNILANLFGYFYLDVRSVSLFDDLVPGQASTLYVRLGDPSKVDEAARTLERLSWSMDAMTTTELKDMNEDVSKSVDNLVVIMGLVSVLIGGIGIINTMLVIVSRRATEVAVLKTLGLEPREVMLLFLVEALLMGVLGSLFGILGGWGLAFAVKGVAENFLGQSLVFAIAARPAINGFVVGILITAIFGFLPMLAAGQIRPANVLRPSDTIIPKAGRLSAFVTAVFLILALSLVAQGMLLDLLDDVYFGEVSLKSITTMLGAGYGVTIAVPVLVGGLLSLRSRRGRRKWLLRVLTWVALLVGLPALGALFGYNIPALIILTITALLVGYLYIALWLVIWAVGGGRVREIWPGILVLLFPLFWPLIPVLIVLLIPTWILGWLIQRYTFVDFKIAMRSMLASKGRGASTLVALVVGVFTLSLITMLVDSITGAFENLLEAATGGNLMVMSAGGRESLDDIRGILNEQGSYVRSSAIVGSYQTQLTGYWDASAQRELTRSMRQNLSWSFQQIDGREIGSNLPDVEFNAGRNLDPRRDNKPDADGAWPVVIRADMYWANNFQIEVGDVLTLTVAGNSDNVLKLRVVGIMSEDSMMIGISNAFAPLAAFEDYPVQGVFAIADVKEDNIRDVRRSLSKIPGTFALETRFLNDLINRLVDQFTSFPILVAGLALVTGGVVIANSVALSTLERRREIGVMKAIGLQRERVLGMLLLENGLMGIVGGLIGVGISFIGIVLLLSQMFKDQLGNTIPYFTAFSLMGLCIGISLLAAIFSVWGASGEKPLNILRYE
jgi:ABC-type antimicrobial peptide transport system permease subunit